MNRESIATILILLAVAWVIITLKGKELLGFLKGDLKTSIEDITGIVPDKIVVFSDGMLQDYYQASHTFSLDEYIEILNKKIQKESVSVTKSELKEINSHSSGASTHTEQHSLDTEFIEEDTSVNDDFDFEPLDEPEQQKPITFSDDDFDLGSTNEAKGSDMPMPETNQTKGKNGGDDDFLKLDEIP